MLVNKCIIYDVDNIVRSAHCNNVSEKNSGSQNRYKSYVTLVAKGR